MNDELNPKLREFEEKLRRLKPLDVASLRLKTGVPAKCRWERAVRPIVYALLTTAAALVIVCLIPQPHTEHIAPPRPTPQASRSTPYAFPTMRQQLAQLFDEMNVAAPIAETKPEYRVVEIVVCDAPPTAIRQQRHLAGTPVSPASPYSPALSLFDDPEYRLNGNLNLDLRL